MGTLDKNSVDQSDRIIFTNHPIKAILVSSNPLILMGFTTLLQNVNDIKLLGNAPSRIDMMLMIDDLNPSLIIINDDDAGSTPPKVLETLRLVINEYPNLNILMLLHNQNLELELSALKFGARGILSEDFDKKTLIDCIKYTTSGGLWLRTRVMEEFIIEHLSAYKEINKESESISLSCFTRRELQITQLASKGYKNREISEILFISEKTVKHHMSRIFRKLNIEKRTQLKGLIL